MLRRRGGDNTKGEAEREDEDEAEREDEPEAEREAQDEREDEDEAEREDEDEAEEAEEQEEQDAFVPIEELEEAKEELEEADSPKCLAFDEDFEDDALNENAPGNGLDDAFVPETVGVKEESIADVRGSDVGPMSTTSTLEDGTGSDKDGDAFDSKWCKWLCGGSGKDDKVLVMSGSCWWCGCESETFDRSFDGHSTSTGSPASKLEDPGDSPHHSDQPREPGPLAKARIKVLRREMHQGGEEK